MTWLNTPENGWEFFILFFFFKAEYNSLSEGCAFDNKNFIHYFAWILLQSKVRVDLETAEEI